MERIEVNLQAIRPELTGQARTCKATPDDKRKEREELARLQAEFLENNGKIQVLKITQRTPTPKFGKGPINPEKEQFK